MTKVDLELDFEDRQDLIWQMRSLKEEQLIILISVAAEVLEEKSHE